MLKYILKRILQAIPLLILITIICFTLINLAPYDAVDAVINDQMTQEEIDAKREQYGLNDSLPVQYIRWVQNICKGEFGNSLISGTSIRHDLVARIPATVKLALPSYASAYLLAIVLGLIAGSHKNKWADKLIDGFCSVGIAVPRFWLAMMMLYLFGYKWELFPLWGMHTIGREDDLLDYLSHFAMPYVVMTVGMVPALTRFVRGSTITQLKEDYVMVQQAFGAKKVEILFKHVCKNVLTPLITQLGMSLPNLVTGAVVVESIFAWPGIGSYFVNATSAMDYPIIMAILLMSGTLVILGNLLSDVLYCLVDPRIKSMK